MKLRVDAQLLSLFFVCFSNILSGQAQRGPVIGVIVESESMATAVEVAFLYINKNQYRFQLVDPARYKMITVDSMSPASSIQAAFELASLGVVAVVGPMSSSTVMATQDVLGALGIPHLSPVATSPLLEDVKRYPSLIRLSPSDSQQSQIIFNFILDQGWKHVAIIASDTPYGRYGLSKLLVGASTKDVVVWGPYFFPPGTNDTLRNILGEIKDIGVRSILLNCHAEDGVKVLAEAANMSMTEAGWAWLTTDGVTAATELLFENGTMMPFSVGLVGTTFGGDTGFLREDIEKVWKLVKPEQKYITPFEYRVVDSILAVAYGMSEYLRSHPYEIMLEDINDAVKNLTNLEPLEPYISLLDSILKANGDGCMNRIRFEDNRGPMFYTYDLMQGDKDGWRRVGYWNRDGLLAVLHRSALFFMGNQRTVISYQPKLTGRVMKVVTFLQQPFVMFKKGIAYNQTNSTDSNDPLEFNVKLSDLEGLAIDVLAAVAKRLELTCEILVEDTDGFGHSNPETGLWEGPIRHLVRREADIGIGPITVTEDRETAVDFTPAYFWTGLTLIGKIPEDAEIMMFLRPLNTSVWLAGIFTLVFSGFCVSTLERMSPFGAHGDFVHNVFGTELVRTTDTTGILKSWRKAGQLSSVLNCIFSCVASFLNQGVWIHPTSHSGRAALIAWWLGILVFVQTYTAQFTAMFTAERMKRPIEDVKQLPLQQQYRFGVVKGSVVDDFFRESIQDEYRRITKIMQFKDDYVTSIAEGLDRARREKFIYVEEAAAVEYAIGRPPCNLMMMGQQFSTKLYAFGLAKRSKYYNPVSWEILKLIEEGAIELLTHKWFVSASECSSVQQEAAAPSPVVGWLRMRGIFYVIYLALAIGAILCIAESTYSLFNAVDPKHPKKAKTLEEAWQKRCMRMRRTFLPEARWNKLLKKGTKGTKETKETKSEDRFKFPRTTTTTTLLDQEEAVTSRATDNQSPVTTML